MIEMRNVTFRYEQMVMDFTLKVPRGAFMGIIGPSGAGKSTLLALLAGFEQPLSGSISFAGLDMTHAPPSQRPVSMVFQDHNDFAHLDLFANVALGISPSLKLDQSQRAAVNQALEQVGLEKLKSRKPGEVSGGERQRVAIARALVRKRPVLLLDEPFAALGPALRREMLDLIVALKRASGLTVLMVSHQPEDALAAADLVAFVSEGNVRAAGPTRDMLQRPPLPEIRDYLGISP